MTAAWRTELRADSERPETMYRLDLSDGRQVIVALADGGPAWEWFLMSDGEPVGFRDGFNSLGAAQVHAQGWARRRGLL
jgi:hypothetical protein